MEVEIINIGSTISISPYLDRLTRKFSPVFWQHELKLQFYELGEWNKFYQVLQG